MIGLLQALWTRISEILFPKDYYSWQTLIYLGIFSFTMSWVARVAVGPGIAVTVIASGGWLFFALGIGWLLDQANIRFLGLRVAPWAMGALFCIYISGLFPFIGWRTSLMAWPIVSVLIAAIPQFYNYELDFKVPPPPIRQQLILLSLLALLFSNWFQFYFRLQNWFDDYPSLLTDDFSRSGFVSRLSAEPEEQARGTVLLTSAEIELRKELNDTPWSYVERWLLNLDEKLVNLEIKTIDSLVSSKERDLWRLEARPRTIDGDRYGLDLMAVWLGPTSLREGYYLEKECTIRPRVVTDTTVDDRDTSAPPDQVAEVKCELPTPKRPGRPLPAT